MSDSMKRTAVVKKTKMCFLYRGDNRLTCSEIDVCIDLKIKFVACFFLLDPLLPTHWGVFGQSGRSVSRVCYVMCHTGQFASNCHLIYLSLSSCQISFMPNSCPNHLRGKVFCTMMSYDDVFI